jgi:hypothetical protein
LQRYAQEVVFRENYRGCLHGWPFHRVAATAGRIWHSPDFCGCWHRHPAH